MQCHENWYQVYLILGTLFCNLKIDFLASNVDFDDDDLIIQTLLLSTNICEYFVFIKQY